MIPPPLAANLRDALFRYCQEDLVLETDFGLAAAVDPDDRSREILDVIERVLERAGACIVSTPDAGHAAESIGGIPQTDVATLNNDGFRGKGTARAAAGPDPYVLREIERARSILFLLAEYVGSERASAAAGSEESCLWCEGTGQEWSSAARYKRVPCRYCNATGKATAEINAGFRGEEAQP